MVHELLERFDAHLKADQFYSVIANMRGSSPEEVATVLLKAEGLQVRGGGRQAGRPLHMAHVQGTCCTHPAMSHLMPCTRKQAAVPSL